MTTREEMLQRIRSNIAQHGFHINLVLAKSCPRFAYSVGLGVTRGAELIFAGGAFFTDAQLMHVLREFAKRDALSEGGSVEIGDLGSFSLRRVDASWAVDLLLAAFDVYGQSQLKVLQIVPNPPRMTIDVPDLSKPYSTELEPVWRWLKEKWGYSVAPESVAITNLAALQGHRVTEAMRWEDGEWELFAGPGPDVAAHEVRTVPLATMLAVDPSLVDVLSLSVGAGLYRDESERRWHPWVRRAN